MGRDDGSPFVPIHGNGAAPRPRGVARSAFGLQSDSRHATLPIHTFGLQSGREGAGKVFISAEHTAVDQKGKNGPLGVYQLPPALGVQPASPQRSAPRYSFSHLDRLVTPTPCTQVPGPGTYEKPSAFGSQPDSLKETGARCKMGTANRSKISKEYLSERMMTGMLGTLGPDPGTYPGPASIGKQASSQKRSSPAFSLPQTARLQAEYERLAQSMPPPGQYETWLSIGRQTQSQWKTAPSTSWAKVSGWDAEKARFLSLSHARTLLGTASPGNYDHQSPQNTTSFGKQTLSGRTSPSRTSFGTAPKMVFKVSNTPGPGHYD